MKTLYQYSIKTDGEFTRLFEGKKKIPLVAVNDDAESYPMVAAGILRDLAKFLLERAEIIEELETGKKAPSRKPLMKYRAEIIEVAE